MRNEIENPITLPKFTFKRPYQEPNSFVGLTCECCDRQAVYRVNGAPHCKLCMYDAIDSEVEVRVRTI